MLSQLRTRVAPWAIVLGLGCSNVDVGTSAGGAGAGSGASAAGSGGAGQGGSAGGSAGVAGSAGTNASGGSGGGGGSSGNTGTGGAPGGGGATMFDAGPDRIDAAPDGPRDATVAPDTADARLSRRRELRGRRSL